MFYGFMDVSGASFGHYTIFNITGTVVYRTFGTRQDMEKALMLATAMYR